MRLALLAVLASVLAGCILTDAPAKGVLVAGEIDGSSATQRYFKLYLKDGDGILAIANFDRVDWYVTGIEKEVTERSYLSASVRGDERGVLNEIVARDVVSPSELNGYLFENMEQRAVAEGRPFDRAALDREWDERLALLGPTPPATPAAPSAPTLAPSVGVPGSPP